MVQSCVEISDWSRLPSEPLVTIVMPAYNHQRYLREAIEGVVGQKTDFPIELIIGDDSSTDRTREIAIAQQQAHPARIRLLTSDNNVGMHENAARLIAAARGRYLAFCEGDDSWHRPDKLSAQIAALESSGEISLVCSSWRIISEEGAILMPDVLDLDGEGTQSFDLDDILVGRVKTVTVCTRTELIRQALRVSPLCQPGRYPFADSPMWVEASRHGRCLCLPEPYATYRLSLNSATRPRDIMDVYRFIAGASEFDRDVLGMYPLPQGKHAATEARIVATRKRLRALALLGESCKVRGELRWLQRLGGQAGFREYLLYLLSVLTQAGTLGAPLRRWVLVAWRALTLRRRKRMPIPRAPQTRPERIENPA